MSQITLQGPFVGASPSAAAPSGVPGVIADPPPAVSQLANGHLLQGEVVGRNEQGQTLVRTELGTLAVNTKAQLPPGSQVTLQIRTHGAQLQIAVMQVDGHSPRLRGDLSATSLPASVKTAAPPPTTPASGPAAGLPGTIDNPPASISGLPKGAVLQGSVLGRDSAGHFLVRTDFGTLPLATEVQLASGNRVSLRITAVLPQVQVLVLPSDGAAHATQPGAAAASAPAGRPTAPASQAAPQAGANSVGQSSPAGSSPPPNPHGASTVDVLAVGQSLRAVVTASPGAAQPAPALASPAASAAVPAEAPLALTPGGTLEVRVTQVAPPASTSLSTPAPAATAATPAPATPGLVRLEGLVIGQNTSGQPIVQTPAGSLTLQIKAQLPAGTRLLLELPLQQLAAPPAPDSLPSASQPSSLLQSWPALQRALEALQGLDGTASQQQLSAQGPSAPLPQPGPRLSSGMLFFINALSGGNPELWLNQLAGGQVARRLERAGQSELLSRLTGDLGTMSRLADAAGEGWRLLPIPLYDGNQVHQLRLFLRGGKGGAKPSDGGPEATRFVLEVTLAKLGDLQLDGLVRERRFDLILRSRQSLPPSMRQDITDIFQAANEATGYAGSIAFQDSPDWMPMPLETSLEESAGVLV